IARIFLFTADRLWCASSYLLFEQASFGDHDDVAGAQGNVALEVLTGFVGFIVKHEDILARTAATPDLDSPLGGKRTETTRQCYGLHQGGFLPHNVGTGSQDLA